MRRRGSSAAGTAERPFGERAEDMAAQRDIGQSADALGHHLHRLQRHADGAADGAVDAVQVAACRLDRTKACKTTEGHAFP